MMCIYIFCGVDLGELGAKFRLQMWPKLIDTFILVSGGATLCTSGKGQANLWPAGTDHRLASRPLAGQQIIDWQADHIRTSRP